MRDDPRVILNSKRKYRSLAPSAHMLGKCSSQFLGCTMKRARGANGTGTIEALSLLALMGLGPSASSSNGYSILGAL